MQLTKKMIKKMIQEEMEGLHEMDPMGMPGKDPMGSGLSLPMEFRILLKKYPNVTLEQAMQALKSAFNPNFMQESKKGK